MKLADKTDAASSYKMVAIQYPLSLSFEDWLLRDTSQLTCQLLNRLGLKPEILYMPPRRAFAEMAAGTVDMMLGTDYVFDAKTRCYVKFVPYRYYKISATYFDTQRRANEPTKLEDFSGKRMITLTPHMFENLSGINIDEIVASDNDSMFSLLRLGRADYLISDTSIRPSADFDNGVNPQASGAFFQTSVPFDVRFSGMLFNINRPGMAGLFTKFGDELQHLRKEASFQSFIKADPGFSVGNAPSSMFSKYTKMRQDHVVCD